MKKLVVLGFVCFMIVFVSTSCDKDSQTNHTLSFSFEFDPMNDNNPLPPDGWSKKEWVGLLSKSYEERLAIAGSFIAAELDVINFKKQLTETENGN